MPLDPDTLPEPVDVSDSTGELCRVREVLGHAGTPVWRRTPDALEVDLGDAHTDLPGVAIRVFVRRRPTPRHDVGLHE